MHLQFSQYYFEERFDLVRFVKLVAAEGLFLFLRIGPYACAEWNFGSVYYLDTCLFKYLDHIHTNYYSIQFCDEFFFLVLYFFVYFYFSEKDILVYMHE